LSSILEKKQVLWQKPIQSNFFQKKCKRLLNDVPEVRYIELLDSMGNQVAGSFRRGIKLLKTLEERKRMNIEAVLRVKTREDFDYNLGPVKYAAARREKVVMMSFPIGDNILLISANHDIVIDETARKIMDSWGITT